MRLYLDFETHSTIPIRRGTDRYLDGATPLLATYATDDKDVHYVDFVHGGAALNVNYDLYDEIWAHNAFFDRMVLERLLGIKTDIRQWRCSMAQALSHGLPGGLDPLCKVLNVPQELAKIEDGQRLIRKFCCGKEILKNDPEWPLFIKYAINDITAMRECIKGMPSWNYQGDELKLWHVDQEINNRGFKVDVQLADEAIKALKKEKGKLDDAIWIQTCGDVTAATQRDKLLVYLCEKQGCFLPDLTAPTIREALEDESLDESTKAILRIRLAAASTSGSKFSRLKESVGKGNRLRGTMQFAGASRTARWSGRIFQPQNLPRPTMKLGDIRNVIECIRNGTPDLVSLFAPIGKACMNSIRGLIIADDDAELMISDYSAIEGRANAWLAGEHWKVKAFRDKQDMYCRIYEQAFNLPPGSVTDEDKRRQIGKVMELALGYQGGVGAFINMATVYNLDLDEIGRQVVPEEKSVQAWDRAVIAGETFGLTKEVYCACDTLKLRYRRANPEIQKFWYALEDAARTVITKKDPALKVHVGMLTFDCDKYVMRIRKPNGHYLCYWLPKLGGRKIKNRELDESDFNEKGEISYMAWRNKKWVRTKTYGGKLCENIVQAVSRDLLGFALLGLSDARIPVVLHVHDEIIAEPLRNSGLTFEQYNHIVQTRPKWAVGFPLEAKGYQGSRYEKR
jgi:DNA polymerase